MDVTRIPHNQGITRAPFLLNGSFIRNLKLQKRVKGPTGQTLCPMRFLPVRR